MLYQLLRELDKQTEISNFSTEYLQQEIERRKKAENSVVSRTAQMKAKLDTMLKMPYDPVSKMHPQIRTYSINKDI